MPKVNKNSSSIDKFSNKSPETYLKNPHELMTESWKNNQEIGSSTLVIVTFPQDESRIYTSLVGDSGYCILRKGENDNKKYSLFYESKSQQRRFNFPYQLGWSLNGDSPRVANNADHEVKEGDIVILATDGVLDNLDPKGVLCQFI